jgi:hypothetical protein
MSESVLLCNLFAAAETSYVYGQKLQRPKPVLVRHLPHGTRLYVDWPDLVLYCSFSTWDTMLYNVQTQIQNIWSDLVLLST